MMKILSASAALALALGAAMPALAAPAGKFLHDAIQGDNGEIGNGSLAQARGHSAGVRQFGATLLADHSQAKAQAIAAARRERVGVPSGMMPEARSLHRRLLGLHGREFDRVFVAAMIDDHRKDIAKFEAQARSGDAVTRRLAQEQLPVLRKHLRIAESLR
jgi:putative membrane protein